MGIGIKRLFRKKKPEDQIKTPNKTKGTPGTPPTQLINHERGKHLKYQPVKNLLDDLNVHEPTEGDPKTSDSDFELVLGDVKVPQFDVSPTAQGEATTEITEVATTPEMPSTAPVVSEPNPSNYGTRAAENGAIEISQDNNLDIVEAQESNPASLEISQDSAPDPELLEISQDSPSESVELSQDGGPETLEISNETETDIKTSPIENENPVKQDVKEEGEENQIKGVDSPLVPRQLVPVVTDMVTVETRSSPSDDQLTLSGNEDHEHSLTDGAQKSNDNSAIKTFSAALIGMVERVGVCAAELMSPESVQCGNMTYADPVQKLFPTVENACIPIVGPRLDKVGGELVRQYSYYDDQFAIKMLDELTNVGYALVHHHLLETKDETEDGDWVGRSVTLILRPGICNRLQVQAPYLEWATLGGGLNNVVESTTLSLLDIHSIATSTAEDMELRGDSGSKKGNDGSVDDQAEKEDLQCLFSMTTKQGQIYVMEAITPDESQRLVAGVKNLACTLSRQLIAGDKNALSDFFDNAQEPDEIRLSPEEAILRISHALLDYLSRA